MDELFSLNSKKRYFIQINSMVLVLKRGASKREIAALEKKLSAGKASGFDARKYNGKVKLKGDALEIQKQLRNEWKP